MEKAYVRDEDERTHAHDDAGDERHQGLVPSKPRVLVRDAGDDGFDLDELERRRSIFKEASRRVKDTWLPMS